MTIGDSTRGRLCSRGSGRASFFSRLYTGTGAFDIVGRRKPWYVLFGVLVLVCVGSIVFRGFNLGIDFTGGTQIQFPAAGTGSPGRRRGRARRSTSEALGQEPAAVQTVGTGDRASVLIRSEPLDAESARHAQAGPVRHVPADRQRAAQPALAAISNSAVSGTWGGQITRQALIALAVFLVLVTIFLAFYFERAMAVAALVALVHDVVVTAGIYSIVGFEVTPATVIGLLTILGLLALRHGRRVRQGQGEHPRAARADPPHLRRGGQPGAQPDADALDQHLADRGAAGGGPDGRRRRAARGRHAGRPRAGADRRHPRRRAVLGAAGHPDPGRPQDARPAHPRAGPAGGRPPRRRPRRPAGEAAPGRPSDPTSPTTTCWRASCAGSGRWPPRPGCRPARHRPAGEAGRQRPTGKSARPTGKRRR